MKLEVNENNVRLDVYLTNNTELSRTKIQKLIKEGNILVNNKVCPSNYKVKENDIIEIENIWDFRRRNSVRLDSSNINFY